MGSITSPGLIVVVFTKKSLSILPSSPSLYTITPQNPLHPTVPTNQTTQQDRDLATLFVNCLPNTLDTTVQSYNDTDTFVITGARVRYLPLNG